MSELQPRRPEHVPHVGALGVDADVALEVQAGRLEVSLPVGQETTLQVLDLHAPRSAPEDEVCVDDQKHRQDHQPKREDRGAVDQADRREDEEEIEVTPNVVPAAVKDAVANRYGDATVTSWEEIRDAHGATVDNMDQIIQSIMQRFI